MEPRLRRLQREKPAGAEIRTTLSHSTDVRGISTSPPPQEGTARPGRGAASGRALRAAPRWQTRRGGAAPPSAFNSALKGQVEVESDPRPGLAGPPAPQGPPAGPACGSNGPARRTRAHWTGSSPGSPTVQQGSSCILTGKPGNKTPRGSLCGAGSGKDAPARPGGLEAARRGRPRGRGQARRDLGPSGQNPQP